MSTNETEQPQRRRGAKSSKRQARKLVSKALNREYGMEGDDRLTGVQMNHGMNQAELIGVIYMLILDETGKRSRELLAAAIRRRRDRLRRIMARNL